MEALKRQQTRFDPLRTYGINDFGDLVGCLIAREYRLFVPVPLLALQWRDLSQCWPTHDELNLDELRNVMAYRPDRELMEALSARLQKDELVMVLRGASPGDVPCWRSICQRYGIMHVTVVPGSTASMWEDIGFRIVTRNGR